MNTKPALMMMIGIPGSGKTSMVKCIETQLNKFNEKYIVLSSDFLRQEMFGDVNDQEHNGEVFNEMTRRTKEALKNGITVIYDATNISSKRRANFLKCQIGSIDCEKHAVYMGTPFEECFENDARRERTVGKDVISRMIKQLQVPMYDEGWDNIMLCSGEPSLMRGVINTFEIKDYEDYRSYLNASDITRVCLDYNQFNPHHTLTLDKHMFKSFEAIEGDNLELKLACLLHDIGKPYCQQIDEDGVAHYYGHDGLSAQLAIRFLKENHTFSDNLIVHVATLIQLHMRMFDAPSIPSIKERLHPKLFKELELLHEADIKAK